MHYQLTTHPSLSPVTILSLCSRSKQTHPFKDFKTTNRIKPSNKGAKKQYAKPNPPSSQNELNLNKTSI
jgi:hypothetical protein